jgi:hypothetical protein
MSASPSTSLLSRLPSTRVLLICAALAAVQVGVFLALAPALVSLPALSPPLYAVLAGAHSVMIFLAPRVTGARGAATITALVAGLVIAASSPIGLFVTLLILVPGVVVDLALLIPGRRSARTTELRYLAGALVAAAVLFTVSLPAFSGDHLTAWILIGAAAGRLVGEGLAYVCARALGAGLARAGIRPAVR